MKKQIIQLKKETKDKKKRTKKEKIEIKTKKPKIKKAKTKVDFAKKHKKEKTKSSSKPKITKSSSKSKISKTSSKSNKKLKTNKKQIRKKVKATYKQRIKNTQRYYQKRLGYHISQFNRSSLNNPQEKKRVQHVIDDLSSTVDFIINSDIANNAKYLDCVRGKYREVMKFLKKLEKYDYSLGRYIKYEGFHQDFAPEDIIIQNSPKVSDALENAKNTFNQCDKYLYKDK